MNKKVSVVVLGMIIFASCGGTNLGVNPPPADPIRAQEIIDNAWIEFENNRFQNAISFFNEAKKVDNSILDIFNGLGWSYFQIHNLNSSLFNFTTAIGTDSSFTDAMAGNSIAAFEKNEYDITILSITTIARKDSLEFDIQGADDYVFAHDATVTSKRIRKILALSYYYSGNFTGAYNQLTQFLDPLTNVKQDSETFLMDLLTALEKI